VRTGPSALATCFIQTRLSRPAHDDSSAMRPPPIVALANAVDE
jgi:hypothetical protein